MAIADCYSRTKLVGIKKKLDRRETTRERKALAAAHLEKSIEKELLERLRSKAYGDAPLNVNEDVWKQVLNLDKGKDRQLDDELEMEDDESLADEEELEDDDGGDREFVEDSDDESVGDLEDYTGSEVSHMDPWVLGRMLILSSLTSLTLKTMDCPDRSSHRTSKSRTRRTKRKAERKTSRLDRKQQANRPLQPMGRLLLVQRGKLPQKTPRRVERGVSRQADFRLYVMY